MTCLKGLQPTALRAGKPSPHPRPLSQTWERGEFPPAVAYRLLPCQIEHTEGARPVFFAQIPLVQGDVPALRLQGFQQAQTDAAKRIGEQEASAWRKIRLEDSVQVGMQRLGIENIRAEDPVVARGVLPVRPVCQTVFEAGNTVPLTVLLTEGQ